jgi:hypothetical protein
VHGCNSTQNTNVSDPYETSAVRNIRCTKDPLCRFVLTHEQRHKHWGWAAKKAERRRPFQHPFQHHEETGFFNVDPPGSSTRTKDPRCKSVLLTGCSAAHYRIEQEASHPKDDKHYSNGNGNCNGNGNGNGIGNGNGNGNDNFNDEVSNVRDSTPDAEGMLSVQKPHLIVHHSTECEQHSSYQIGREYPDKVDTVSDRTMSHAVAAVPSEPTKLGTNSPLATEQRLVHDMHPTLCAIRQANHNQTC